MDNNKQNSTDDTSFLEDNGGGIQFKDILFLILHNLHWFILCAVIGAGIAYYIGVRGIFTAGAIIMFFMIGKYFI